VGEARYLVRLDDAHPWRNRERWDRIEALLDRFSIKPIVAVVPECRDPDLRVGDEDLGFWDRVRSWRAKGWTLALHGHTHELVPCGSSLVPLNRYTEFAGVPEAAQRTKIRAGWARMSAEGVPPTVWVAPAHTFDRTTLRVLAEETSIRTISDGVARRPFLRYGMVWVPQQLWRPRVCPPGVWTLCLHPNDHTPEFEAKLEAFFESQAGRVMSLESLGSPRRPWSLADGLFSLSFFFARNLKRMVRP
jgi:predicted deacetylase